MTNSVLLVIPDLGFGGVERVIVNIANALADQGVAVGVCTFTSGGIYERELSPSVNRYCLNTTTSAISALNGRAVEGLIRVSADYHTIVAGKHRKTEEIVYTCKLWHDKRGSTKKYVVRVGTILSLAHGFKRRFIKKAKLKRIYQKMDGIIAISNGVKYDLLRMLGPSVAKIQVIYNPVDRQRIAELAEQPVDVEAFSPYFLSVGRLSHDKDQETLIRAFAIVSRSMRQPCHLMILGSGHLEGPLKSLCRKLRLDNVHFQGNDANPWKYMRRAVALVSSSVIEGFGNVIAEAMVCGVPVVATTCPGGPREILQEGANGYLVEPRNPEDMAAAMTRILTNPAEVEMKTSNATRFVQELDLPTVARKYAEVFFD